SAPKPAAAAALSKPKPAKSAGPAVKGGFIFKDPFMATEVLATQGTMHSEESSDKDAQGDDDDSDDGNVAMDVDSIKHPEETWLVVPTKASVTEVEALAPVLVANKTKEDPLLQIALYR
ncbi:hypothetical protein C0995_002446, partial [Termitomyces sp. Mi166